MKEFANAYGFTLITSSPQYAQSNGLAERTCIRLTIIIIIKDVTFYSGYFEKRAKDGLPDPNGPLSSHVILPSDESVGQPEKVSRRWDRGV